MFGPFVRHDIDYAAKTVSASFAGGLKSRAVYRGAEGCLVVQGPVRSPATVSAARAAACSRPLPDRRW